MIVAAATLQADGNPADRGEISEITIPGGPCQFKGIFCYLVTGGVASWG
jgi:hypothetical protein